MKYPPINPELFSQNRHRFVAELKPNSLAVFNSNDEMPKSADQNFLFRQNADLFYLTGIDQEQSILVLFPDCPNEKFKESLFLRKTNKQIAVWEGHKYTKEEAREVSGIQNIYWMEEFDTLFPPLMHVAEHCYLNTNEHDRYEHNVAYRDLRFTHAMRADYPLHKYQRSAPIMAALRSIKSDIEIELIQTACDITEKAFRRVLAYTKPGVQEFEIEAEITHEFMMNRARGHAYSPIVASGANACVLHYVDNNQACKDGDVILMDFGADYSNYCADMTRAIPVNGKFTERQKEVYNAVLNVMRASMKLLVPGTLLDDYHKNVGSLMEEELIKLGLLDAEEVKKQDPESPLYKKYFMHGTSHYLGIDVHDLGSRYQPMAEGMVFTCEPGIYIPEESLGIRLENDIVITSNGVKDLMKNIPIEADEIEALMDSLVDA